MNSRSRSRSFFLDKHTLHILIIATTHHCKPQRVHRVRGPRRIRTRNLLRGRGLPPRGTALEGEPANEFSVPRQFRATALLLEWWYICFFKSTKQPICHASLLSKRVKTNIHTCRGNLGFVIMCHFSLWKTKRLFNCWSGISSSCHLLHQVSKNQDEFKYLCNRVHVSPKSFL